MADIYDIVTTTVYLPKDAMALTLDGTTRWPNVKQLTKLGTMRCGLTPRASQGDPRPCRRRHRRRHGRDEALRGG